jgi:hypothetical protein
MFGRAQVVMSKGILLILYGSGIYRDGNGRSDENYMSQERYCCETVITFSGHDNHHRRFGYDYHY